MSGNLKDRLRRLREQVKSPASPNGIDINGAPVKVEFPGDSWQQIYPGVFKCVKYHTPNQFSLDQIIPAGYFSAHAKGQYYQFSDLAFFDLETTGLSGGSGTVAFLAAIGCMVGTDLQITQLFLADYPYEANFLQALLAELSDKPCLVSYNGLCYDLPLLRTRCILNGLSCQAFPMHIDLVYCARSLWRTSLPDRSLHTVEQRILGRQRHADIPGCLIPETWFRFLKAGAMSDLELVYQHNADDIISLAELLFWLMDGIQAKQNIAMADDYGQARLWARCDVDEAINRLKPLAAGGHRLATKLLLKLYRQRESKDTYRNLRNAVLAQYAAKNPEGKDFC